MGEKTYQKNAWVLIFILAIAGILFGLVQLAGVVVDTAGLAAQLGQPSSAFAASNPRAWSALIVTTQFDGLWLLSTGIFGAAITYSAYRKGERWAWYVQLYTPLAFIAAAALDYTTGGNFWPLLVLFLIISLAGLALPYRKFFPK
jgi:hypothetical protein